MNRKNIFTLICTICAAFTLCKAQENVAPVNYNPFLKDKAPATQTAKKGTSVSLPFFEDFTGSYVYPDSNRWMDREVYVNNTMGALPISRGVATFDALNANGMPYNPYDPNVVAYADSLTSVPIDLSLHSAADSIYMSFFYQPAGNGFAPDAGDSLMLFFLQKNGEWRKMWAVDGANVQPFAQVMIPVTDTEFFYNQFQFQFVNIASVGLNDDVWNLDYIKINSGRNINDTAVNDIAFSEDPTYMLNDLTYMPYRQFLANTTGERATQQQAFIHNNYPVNQSIVFSNIGTETTTSTSLGSSTNNPLTITAHSDQTASVNVFTGTIPSPGPDNKVIFENKFFFNNTPVGDYSRGNDTIVRDQVFDNYLAYDDGTAEKSYFLNLFPTLPGKIAIEYHLNQPDTLRGMAIYFGRQVPLATNKFLTANIYSQLQGVNGAAQDVTLYTEDFLSPGYADTVNHFWYYKFASYTVLPAGTFYLSCMQPALSGSDSVYYGLDVNRIGGNHLYFNVLNVWTSSTISGALMVRPVFGQPIAGTGISETVHTPFATWNVFPNPATDRVYFNTTDNGKPYIFELTDVQGKTIQSGPVNSDGADIHRLMPGMYLIRIRQDGLYSQPQKIIKL